MGKIFEKIIQLGFYLLVFLLPLFWLPFSFEFYEFNKQYLIFFLVSVIFLAWLAKMLVSDKEVRVQRTIFDIPILGFVAIATLSAVFSVDKFSSLFGSYGRFSNGLITLLCLAIFYFLLANNTETVQCRKEEEGKSSRPVSVEGLLNAFLLSVFFVFAFSYFSLFGVWQKLNLSIFRDFALSNTVSGSIQGLAIFISLAVILLVGFLVCDSRWNKKHLAFFFLLLAGLIMLIVINFSPAWIILVFSFGFFLIFSLFGRTFRENINRLLLPIFLIFISLFFLFFDSSSFVRLNLPRESVLSQDVSWKVAFDSTMESVKSLFLGSGIGTYNYDFSKFRPIEFNKNPLWQFRYERSGSYLSEVLGTTGFLGLAVFLFLNILIFLIFLHSSKRTSFIPLVMTSFALFIGQIVYYQNIVLAFSFWFFLGLTAVSLKKREQEKVFSFKDFPEAKLAISTFLLLFTLGVFVSYYFGVKFYLADVNYRKAQLASDKEERVKFLEKAIRLNPNLATYQISLARHYLAQIQEILAMPVSEQNGLEITKIMPKALDAAKKAEEILSNNVSAPETLAMIYRDIQSLVSGSTEWAITYFQKAITLEPKNPVLYTELGKLYLLSDTQKAKENFTKALQLKEDYFDAQVQDALVFEKEDNPDEAMKRLEAALGKYPLYMEAKFQLGRLYFNKGKINEAILQFEDLISVFPNNSNSLYSLGLAYSKKGEKEKAISYFERVLHLNPDNQDVLQKLQDLKK